MILLSQKRRSFLFGLSGLGIRQPFLQGNSPALSSGLAQGSVLGEAGGEHLIHFRDHGNILIKFGSATGSKSLAVGTVGRHFRGSEISS